MRKYAAEFIGTFFLVLTVCVTVLTHSPFAPFAIGAVLMVMIFAGGHISGGHFNPAVTLAVFLRGRLAARDVAPYMAAQIAAGALAAGLARWLTYTPGTVGSGFPAISFTGRELGVAFVVEAVFTFALAYVVLNVATSKAHPDNSFYGLAIGFTVLVGAITVGGLSGGAFNPAVGFGIAIAGIASWSMLWVYVVATMVGAVGAALAFRMLNADDLAPMAGGVGSKPADKGRVPAGRRAA